MGVLNSIGVVDCGGRRVYKTCVWEMRASGARERTCLGGCKRLAGRHVVSDWCRGCGRAVRPRHSLTSAPALSVPGLKRKEAARRVLLPTAHLRLGGDPCLITPRFPNTMSPTPEFSKKNHASPAPRIPHHKCPSASIWNTAYARVSGPRLRNDNSPSKSRESMHHTIDLHCPQHRYPSHSVQYS